MAHRDGPLSASRQTASPVSIGIAAAGSPPDGGNISARLDQILPDPGEEHLFDIENNPFGLTPGHLSKLIEPKSVAVLQYLGGLAGLTKGLQTDSRAGLSVDGNQGDRRRVFGENRLPERKSKSFLGLAWVALQDRVLVLLCIAAIVSLALGLYQTFAGHHSSPGEKGGTRVEWIEGVAILVAVLVVVLVTALNDWQKEWQFRKLNRKREDRLVTVVRSGRAARVSVYDILVGDVMVLEQGDVVPVDGVLIDGHSVGCDESSATGESGVVKKIPADAVSRALRREEDAVDERVLSKMDPFILSGTKVLDGLGTFLVTAVGPHSVYGRTRMALRYDPGMTPLQARLNVLAGYIAKLGSSAGLLLFTVLFIEFLAKLPGNPASGEEKGQNFLQILMTAITIIVVAVPEGLPLAVTLSLAFATKKMTRENNLVRHLQSCETMGNATVICSDKTGTLTENVMTVVGGTLGAGGVSFGDSRFMSSCPNHNGNGSLKAINQNARGEREGEGEATVLEAGLEQQHKLSASIHSEFQELVKESIAVNTTAFEGEESGRPVFVGTKTETALLDWAERSFGLGNLATERARHGPLVHLFPFNSRWKCMGSVIKRSGNKSGYRLLVKGAPEVVLERCSAAVADPKAPLSPSARQPLRAEDRGRISETVSRYASLSLRTLALAYRDMDTWPPNSGLRVRSEGDEDNKDDDDRVAVELDDVVRDMTWIALVAIQDPVREGVPAAVRDCRRASVAVKMVTGDKVETARAIARECGILEGEEAEAGEGEGGGNAVMDGAAFRRLREEQRRGIVRDLRVLARSSPEDKRVLVESLRSLGEVVAVTGDGTNDAPALKAADVGFSMGIMGTDVAKEASDVILMDDNFSSIVKALAWGRAINDAVKKFLQFQITVNITAVVLTFVSAVASERERSVLNAIQLLWVNLIMDTFAALALASDPPNGSLLDRVPEPRLAPLITLTMWKMILGQAVYQLVVSLTLHFAGPSSFLSSYPEAQRRTLVFNVFVFMQIFKLVNSRRIDNGLNIFEGLHRNPLFVVMMTIMVIGQLLIVFFGGAAFDVVRLTGVQWAISLVLGFMSIPIGILIRLFPDGWIRRCVQWVAQKLRFVRRRKSADDEERGRVVVHGDPDHADGDGVGVCHHDLGSTMFSVRDDLAFLKRVRGGRMAALADALAVPQSVGEWKIGQRRRSRSAMRSAVGAPGLLAASIGAMSPGVRPVSNQSQLSGGDRSSGG
ncbi:hypothetical protein P885DRAFT_69416 [Corynascus similis CBS 632.67]